MTKSKEETVQVLVSNFSQPKRKIKEEEVAVRQTIEKLARKLSESQGTSSLLQDIPIEMVMSMIKSGQLTLVAEKLDDSFLRSVESLVQASPITFEAYNSNNKRYQKEKISDTYKTCRAALERKIGKEPAFHDVLLRMYTNDGPFYKKMNAILGGYDKDPNISEATSEEEIKLALLLNVALHRAGLDKRSVEFQTTPDEIFRGQSFGVDEFKKKAEKLDSLYKEGKLATLTPAELSEINIVDIAAKKTLSASSDLGPTTNFAGKRGIVVHVKNPEVIADFYNVANISQFPNESEYISRIPDDIAMLPVNLYQDSTGVTHVEVVCMQSESILLHNSTVYSDTRDSLKKLITETSQQIVKDSFFGMFLSSKDKEQIALLSSLESVINLSEEQLSSFDPAQQEQFLKMSYVLLNRLYKTSPSEAQEKQFNAINNKLQEFSGIFANLNVVHEVQDLRENIKTEHKKISTFLTGLKNYSEDLNNKGKANILEPIKPELETLISLNVNDATIRESSENIAKIREMAENIITKLNRNITLAESLPGLKGRMADIIKSIDHLNCCEKLTPTAPPVVDISARMQSISSSQKPQSLPNSAAIKQSANKEILANLKQKEIIVLTRLIEYVTASQPKYTIPNTAISIQSEIGRKVITTGEYSVIFKNGEISIYDEKQETLIQDEALSESILDNLVMNLYGSNKEILVEANLATCMMMISGVVPHDDTPIDLPSVLSRLSVIDIGNNINIDSWEVRMNKGGVVRMYDKNDPSTNIILSDNRLINIVDDKGQKVSSHDRSAFLEKLNTIFTKVENTVESINMKSVAQTISKP